MRKQVLCSMVLGLAALFCVNGCDDPVQPAPPRS